MKFAKRTISVLLAVLMLVSILPLSVSAASLKITTQPKTSYTEYGSTAKATVKASGDGLKYTWYIKNAGASKYSKSSVTKSTYSVKMTDSTKGRSVYCVVKDKKGKSIKSKTAILRMKATVTTEPKTTYAKQGATAKLTVKAKGDGLKYQWYIKNAGKTKYSKSSVTKSTYSVTMSDKVHGRYVYCVVTDKYGKTDKSKTVVLRQQATITTQPKTTSAALGETAKLTVKAKGDGLKYQWYIKNAGGSKYSKSSITKSTYSVKMSEKVNGRYVYCVVTDKYGKTEKSKTVMLKLKADPLTITMQPEDVYCSVGNEVGFGVVVKGGTAPYTYQWEYTGTVMDGWLAVPEEAIYVTGDMVSAVLLVGQSNFYYDFRIRCVITDAKGAQVITNEARPLSKMVILSQPVNEISNPGNQCTFKVQVSGGTEPYTYQWQWSDYSQPWQDLANYELASGVKTNWLDIIASQDDFDYETKYRCVITDANGQRVITDTVWVERPLYIKTQPSNYAAAVNEAAYFEVTVAGGKGPYTYQWQYTSDSMGGWSSAAWGSGYTTNTLSFKVTSTQEWTNGYAYRCVITDATGKTVTTNTVKVLNKDNLLRITSQPVNDYARHGQQNTFTVQVAGGTGPYTYQWQWSDYSQPWQNLTSNDYYAGVKTNSLDVIVMEYDFDYETKYRCIITDADGTQVITNAVWSIEY